MDEQRGADGTGERRGTGVSKWSLFVLVLAIALAVILGQNTERVDVDVLWASFRAPLFLVVLLAGLGLTVVWEVGTLALRHRRRRARRR
ncbi:MAG: lipopolysaccharide assembly protein LapA domain-containing protein [Acidimicrobiia bacterium]|jgi:uncharacterized integral membrane protein